MTCDINTASLGRMLTLPGLERGDVLELRLWRPYASWAEVERVPGFDANVVQALRDSGATLSPPPRIPDWTVSPPPSF